MVHEKIRERMYALRQTWNELFSSQKLYALDVKVKRLDGNWPITAKQPAKPAIHVNPNFLKSVGVPQTALPSEMEEILQVKTRELLELKKRKLELELEQTKKHLEAQEQQINHPTSIPTLPAAAMPISNYSVAHLMPSADLLHHQQQQQLANIAQPGFQQNFHNVRPQIPAQTQVTPSGVLSLQQQHQQQPLSPQQQQGFTNMSNNANHKTKVYPVNSALLNSIRQRDPRLARQQQSKNLPSPAGTAQTSSRSHNHHNDERLDGKNKSTSSSSSRRGANSKSSRSRSKSPATIRHSTSSNRSSGGSRNGTRGNSSSRSSNKHSSSRDKERKRSESKSSTTSSSSAGSANDRRKSNTAATSNKQDKTNKFDYDTFDIESLHASGTKTTTPSNAHKRKSTSPAASPTKSKRSNKQQHNSKSMRSRSRSPIDYKDIDMRRAPRNHSHNNSPEKRPKLHHDEVKKNDLIKTVASTTMPNGSTITTTTSITATTNDLDKPKLINILETARTAATAHSVILDSSSMDIDLRKLSPPALPSSAFVIPNIHSTNILKFDDNIDDYHELRAKNANADHVVPLPSSSISPTLLPSSSSAASESLIINNATTITSVNIITTINNTTAINAATSSPYDNNSLTATFSTNSNNNTITTTILTTPKSTSTTTMSKVSFKIQKPFNKLEKSTVNSLTAMSSFTSSPSPPASTSSLSMATTNKEPFSKLLGNHSPNSSMTTTASAITATTTTVVNSISGEKRSNSADEEEPMQKKIKAAKLDALFGSEDVDLRKEILQQPLVVAGVMAQQQNKSMHNNNILTTTPATGFMEEEELLDDEKNKSTPPKKSGTSSLDEIRAKLTKTVRSNKFNKNGNEKMNKDYMQRLNLTELAVNEDSQEANEEKIRIILTQAQEMLENNGMNQEQYRDLVQKMMSLNEASKLKEAKRREALKADNRVSDDDDDVERIEIRERHAARDAVFKKRIPKLNKNKNKNGSSNDSPHSDVGAGSAGDGAVTNSPSYDDQRNDAIDLDNNNETTNVKSRKEKRRKPSKWGEQISPWLSTANTNNINNNNNNTNNNNNGSGASGNKRNVNFRNNSQYQQPTMQQTIRMPTQIPWQHCNLPQPFAVNVSPILVGPRTSVPPPPQPPQPVHLINVMPPVAAAATVNLTKPCNSIDNPQAEVVRSVTIDGTSKEIRIYNQVAIVFMNGDVPHEIGFQDGHRSIVIDNMEPFTLQFNDTYKPVTIDGILHHIRFGFPSRELYIDEHWYEIYFGGPAVTVPILNKLHVLKIEGPPPQVNIGSVRRDLVAGKISMIVDAHTIVPLFLDAKVQTFYMDEQEHTVQFVDDFMHVLFNGELHTVEYGGLPKSVKLGNKIYFIRFGTLPSGIVAGKIHVQDMVYIKTKAPAQPMENSTQSEGNNSKLPESLAAVVAAEPAAIASTDSALSTSETAAALAVPTTSATAAPAKTNSLPVLGNLNIDELFQKLVSSGIIGAAGTAPIANAEVKTTDAIAAGKTITNDLHAIATQSPASIFEPVRPINLTKPETIKTRQAAIINEMHSGMQCGSCGVRFPPEQTIKYSQHLDWHFRQNRRGRDSSRKALARKWYYSRSDWILYEEIEDIDERDKNFLEAQNGSDSIDDVSQQRSLGSPATSCAAGPDDVDRACDMCHEKFEQFYNEELEEWHLRHAVRIEEKFYHPLCYEDYKVSLNPNAKSEVKQPAVKSDNAELNTSDDNAVDIVIKVEADDNKDDETKSVTNGTIVDEDDDDDVIVLPNEEPLVTEIIDDDDDDEGVNNNGAAAVGADKHVDEYVPTKITQEEMGTTVEKHDENEQGEKQQQPETKETGKTQQLNETTESDVEIQEPNIPFTDLDNYVEKELPEANDATQAALLNVKIKEEPKDDYDEDDGFEDVGTVLIIPDEEISIQSSEGTQTHTIASSVSPVTIEGPTLLSQNDNTMEQQTAAATTTATTATATTLLDVNNKTNVVDLNANMDGNFETEETHNLSATGPAPAIPLASLVNKIKINITKNTSNSNNSNTNINNTSSSQIATSTTATTAATTASAAAANASNKSSTNAMANETNVSQISVVGSQNNSSSTSSTDLKNNHSLADINPIQTISTIPVLCGGNTFVPKITTSSNHIVTNMNSAPANISTISVIGSSYGNSNSNNARYMMSSKPLITPMAAAPLVNTSNVSVVCQTISPTSATPPQLATTAAAADPEPPIVFKPALKNVALKKTKKVQSGIETSGLCSIM